MMESTVVFLPSAEGVEDPLTEVPRAGARQLVRHAVEAEVAALLAAYADHRTETGRQETPTFAHLGDTYFCALIVLDPKRALGRGEG